MVRWVLRSARMHSRGEVGIIHCQCSGNGGSSVITNTVEAKIKNLQSRVTFQQLSQLTGTIGCYAITTSNKTAKGVLCTLQLYSLDCQ